MDILNLLDLAGAIGTSCGHISSSDGDLVAPSVWVEASPVGETRSALLFTLADNDRMGIII